MCVCVCHVQNNFNSDIAIKCAEGGKNLNILHVEIYIYWQLKFCLYFLHSASCVRQTHTHKLRENKRGHAK